MGHREICSIALRIVCYEKGKHQRKRVDAQNLVFMKEPFEAGKVVPVIDGCYPLSKAAEALWYFEKNRLKVKSLSQCDVNLWGVSRIAGHVL